MALISCKGLEFAYDGNVVLSNVDFDIDKGDYLCIIGNNGSGKSTLMKGLLRLKQPTKGSISFLNDLKRSEIGFLPQQTIAQRDFPASVFEVVLSGRANNLGLKPFYSKADKKIALKSMTKLNINNLQNKSYRELSGGQQQRVLLARALCAASKILLLDEPTTGLDPKAEFEFYELIKFMNNELGITIVIVSHDIEAALKYSNKILSLGKNQRFFGVTSDYKDIIKKDGF